ncbi:MAG: MFS transporter [Thermoplasmata archaeon]
MPEKVDTTIGSSLRFYSSSGLEEKWLVKASFYVGITSAILWYVLILYWAALDFSSKEIGLMEGIGTAAGIVTYLLGGYLADKLGRRKLFLVGLFATAAGLLMFLGERSLVLFASAYTLTNIGGSLSWPCLTALMADKTGPQDMKYFFAVQGFSNQLGTTLAVFFGIFSPGWLNDTYGIGLATGYHYVFLATLACSFVPIIYVFRVTEIKRSREKLLVHYTRPMLKMLGVYSFQNALIGVGAAFVIPWLPLIFKHGMGATDTEVALMVTFSSAVLAVGWLVIPKFAELRGSVVLIAACQIASVLPMVLIPYSPELLTATVLYTARNLLMLVPTPILNAYLMNVVAREIRASFLAISQVAWQLAFAPAAAIAGVAWRNDYSKVEPFFIGGTLYVVASLMFWAYFRRVRDPGDVKNASDAEG